MLNENIEYPKWGISIIFIKSYVSLMKKIKIALVEDSKLLLERLAEGFSLYDSIKIVGKYSNGKSIIDSLEKTVPNVYLLEHVNN